MKIPAASHVSPEPVAAVAAAKPPPAPSQPDAQAIRLQAKAEVATKVVAQHTGVGKSVNVRG
jgi:hypothetical protein